MDQILALSAEGAVAMNDADFEMLSQRTDAAASLGGNLDTKLRFLALDYAIKMGTDVHKHAELFYKFLKGDAE
jgi:hypothetical protein